MLRVFQKSPLNSSDHCNSGVDDVTSRDLVTARYVVTLRRVEASSPPLLIAFHTDLAIRTMQVPRNDEREYLMCQEYLMYVCIYEHLPYICIHECLIYICIYEYLMCQEYLIYVCIYMSISYTSVHMSTS